MLNALGKFFRTDKPLPDTSAPEKSKRFEIITEKHLPNPILESVIQFLNVPDVWNLSLTTKDLNNRLHEVLPSNGHNIQRVSRFLALYLSRQLNQSFMTEKRFEELLDIKKRFPVVFSVQHVACSIFSINQFAECGLITSNNLKSLKIESLTDEYFKLLDVYKELTALDLEYSPEISDNGLTHLSAFTQLHGLNLEGCEHISDKGLESLSHLPLRSLFLTGCSVTGEGLSVFKELNELDLSGCSKITNDGLEALSHLPLRTLYFKDHAKDEHRKITHADLRYLSALTTLRELDLTSFTDEAMQYLPQLTLRKLTVGQITDRGLASIVQCRKLEELHFVRVTNGIPLITDEGLGTLTACSRLRNLTFEWCGDITVNGIQTLTGLSRLKKISIIQCRKIAHLGMLDGLSASSSLEELKFSEVWGTKAHPTKSNLTKLQKLDCTATQVRFLSNLTNLRTLRTDSSSTEELTKKDVKNGLVSLPLLHTLTIRCKHVPETLKHFVKLSQLRTLNLASVNPFNLARSVPLLMRFDSVQTLIVSPHITLKAKKVLRSRFEIIHA